jgi:large subunit ribosomal protein L13
MKTYAPKPEHIERRWYVVDASGQVLGRLASEVATLLRGKHKPMFAPHMDTGDHVIVINADKIELTGNKTSQKFAYRHSGYPGGIKGVRYDEMLADRPVATIQKAVRGMLPKNRLGRQMIKKLHVVAGAEHPHAAQKPVDLAVGERPPWDGLPAPASKPAAAKPATKPASKPEAATAPAPKKTVAKKTAAKKEEALAVDEPGLDEAVVDEAPVGEDAAPKKPAAKKTTAKKTTAKKKAETADETEE